MHIPSIFDGPRDFADIVVSTDTRRLSQIRLRSSNLNSVKKKRGHAFCELCFFFSSPATRKKGTLAACVKLGLWFGFVSCFSFFIALTWFSKPTEHQAWTLTCYYDWRVILTFKKKEKYDPNPAPGNLITQWFVVPTAPCLLSSGDIDWLITCNETKTVLQSLISLSDDFYMLSTYHLCQDAVCLRRERRFTHVSPVDH